MHCGQAIELPRAFQETSGGEKGIPARCHYGFNEKCAKATVNGDSVAPRGDKLKRRTLLSNFSRKYHSRGRVLRYSRRLQCCIAAGDGTDISINIAAGCT